MAEAQLFSKRELKFLDELNARSVRYLVVGLAAAAVQGAPIVTQDVDLWIEKLNDKEFLAAVRKVGGAFVPRIGHNPPMLAGKGLELFDLVVHVHGLEEFDHEYQQCVRETLGSTEVTLLSLEQIIKSKKALNRAKDKLVIPVLEDALRANRGS
ncbi:MAG: hypothetical protein KDD66_03655 [Bdellovibrionales bacterium]|nr:hypothetical protein [Bdellovibrionales bacterium]